MKHFLVAAVFAASMHTAPAIAQADPQDVEALFRAAFGEACYLDEDSVAASDFQPQSWELTWDEEYSDTGYSGRLHQFFCFAGAYNVNFVYYFEDPFNGPVPVAFAVPSFDVNYVDGDYDGPVESIKVRGFSTLLMLTNSEFDPTTGAIQNNAFWRGIGDASSGGRWVFEKGDFVLKWYDVDASYDGEINPERIVEFK